MVEENRPPDAPEAIGRPDGPLEHPTVRYERSDANYRWIIGLIGAAVVVGVLIHVGLWLLFTYYRERQAEVKKSPFPLAPVPSEALPPEPRLEQLDHMKGVERSNALERQAVKEKDLNSYGPTSEEGFIHIPIDRAMQLLENKLPVRTETPGDRKRENGLLDAGAPNSGRMFRGSPR
jgi:hypothetical protein